MRTALIYNFLVESTIIASIAIVLMLIIRKCLGKQLGRKAMTFAWILVAIRLLCPLALPNPLINEIRSPFAPDPAIRPIAGQVKVRIEDAVDRLAWSLREHEAISDMFLDISQSLYNGMFAINLMKVYIVVAACVLLFMTFNTRRKQLRFTWQRMVSILCVAVHWFNPLVWLAAHLLQKDAPKEETGVRKPLAIAFVAVSSLLLVCAFGTAEYKPVLITGADIPQPALISPLPEKPTDDQIITHSIEICSNEFFDTDMSKAQWTIERHSSGYVVIGTGGEAECTLRYLPDGRLASYRLDGAPTSGNGSVQPSDGLGDTLATYCLSLLDSALPGLSNAVEAFDDPVLWQESGVSRAYQSGLTVVEGEVKKGVYFNVDLTQKPRVKTFRLETVLLKHLWKEGIEPLESMYTERLGGFAVQPLEITFTVPQDCISAEKALTSITDYLKDKYGETDQTLRRFEIRYRLTTEGRPNMWLFFLDSGFMGNHSVDQYEIRVDAQTGDIISCYGPEDGNG